MCCVFKMVVVTVDNFEANRVVVKRVDKKSKVFYNVGDKDEKLEKLEIVNDRGTGTVFPVIVNGFRKEENYTTKKWTGNYRMGYNCSTEEQDRDKMTVANKKKETILKFYDALFDAIRKR